MTVEHAAAAERAVVSRHLRRVWALPGTVLGRSGWPAAFGQRLHWHWNYWWQAHLLDCLVDAQLRQPNPGRAGTIGRLIRGVRVRNLGSWTNDYYDDIAWLGLALLRASDCEDIPVGKQLTAITAQLRSGWTDHGGGGIWWRRREKFADDFKNVPSNGPAAILLTRLVDSAANEHGDRADRQRARSTVEWIEEFLVEEETGLVFDGLHVYPNGEVRERENAIYTYCQGVFLGACVELATRDSVAGGGTWAARAVRTIDAVARHVTVPDELGLVLRGQGGGDGGLFAGILARYLALAANHLPVLGAEYAPAAQLATNLVYSSAEAAWRNRTLAPGGPLFGPEWTKPAVLPGRTHRPERDLSVQAGAWMLLEAAAALERDGIEPA